MRAYFCKFGQKWLKDRNILQIYKTNGENIYFNRKKLRKKNSYFTMFD